jgi:flagellar export protein FliJ
MSDLSVLIRLHKHELDEKRRALAALYTDLAALERQQRDLERAFELEKEAVRKAGEVHFTFAQYTETVIKRREELKRAGAELEEHIARAKLSLLDTFSELKKFEMTQEERDRIEAEEQAFRESQELDAVGIEGFRRRKEDS